MLLIFKYSVNMELLNLICSVSVSAAMHVFSCNSLHFHRVSLIPTVSIMLRILAQYAGVVAYWWLWLNTQIYSKLSCAHKKVSIYGTLAALVFLCGRFLCISTSGLTSQYI